MKLFLPGSELSSLTLYAAADDQIYSVTKQVRKNYPGNISEFYPLIECYGNPLTVLKVIPSVSYSKLGTSRSYSFIYCLRDVITITNIGAIQADYSVEAVNAYLSANYPGVKGDFLIIDRREMSFLIPQAVGMIRPFPGRISLFPVPP